MAGCNHALMRVRFKQRGATIECKGCGEIPNEVTLDHEHAVQKQWMYQNGLVVEMCSCHMTRVQVPNNPGTERPFRAGPWREGSEL